MNRIALLFVAVFFYVNLSAHPWKPQNYVIIDTDCGMDDLRAICMLLASPEVRVLAITASDGVLDAETGFHKVSALLYDLHHEGIPVGVNHDTRVKTKPCMPALQTEWGRNGKTANQMPVAHEVIDAILKNTREPVTFICLGSLNTVWSARNNCPGFTKRVKSVLWSSPANYRKGSFNYELDVLSADSVLVSGLKIQTIHSVGLERYDNELVQSISHINNQHAQKINGSLMNQITPYSTAFFDEVIPVFLHYPELFVCDTAEKRMTYVLQDSLPAVQVMDIFNTILTGETENHNQVLNDFPMDTSFYMSDIRPIVETTLIKYGHDEWTAGVMANEMHRHLGIYAIIGVKMGIRAREYFGAGVDEMSVVSHAGMTPPFSCMNDGLQISTGATLGHGLIRVSSDTLKLPVADFTYLNRKIRISLKSEIRNKVEAEVKELSRIYGLDSDIYWDLVRNKAIKYWATFNRHEIFTIELL
ncbi:MAG: nucleoside hydrolase [Bacteroidales bacterium]